MVRDVTYATTNQEESMTLNQQDSPRIARLRSSAEAADVCARMRRDEAEAYGGRTMVPGTDEAASRVAAYELKVAIAAAAREQAELAHAKLITALQATDPEYLTFLETYTYTRFLADGKIGPLAAFRAQHGREYVVQVWNGRQWRKVRGGEGGPWSTRDRAERIARSRENAERRPSSTEGMPHRVVEVEA